MLINPKMSYKKLFSFRQIEIAMNSMIPVFQNQTQVQYSGFT